MRFACTSSAYCLSAMVTPSVRTISVDIRSFDTQTHTHTGTHVPDIRRRQTVLPMHVSFPAVDDDARNYASIAKILVRRAARSGDAAPSGQFDWTAVGDQTS